MWRLKSTRLLIFLETQQLFLLDVVAGNVSDVAAGIFHLPPMFLWVINDFVFSVLQKRKWSHRNVQIIIKFITFSKDKSPVSIALNGYSATTIFKRPEPSWKRQESCLVLSMQLSIYRAALPWWLNLVFQAWQQLQASACWYRRWCADRFRSTAMTWSQTKVSVGQKCKT